MSVVASHAAQPVGPALLDKMTELAILSLLKFMAHFAFCVGLNFVELTAWNKVFTQARVVDQLKVLHERLEHLLAKFTPRADMLCPAALVEGHLKPFNRETCSGLLKVATWVAAPRHAASPPIVEDGQEALS